MNSNPVLVYAVAYSIMWLLFLFRAPRYPEVMQMRNFAKASHGVAIGAWLFIALISAIDGDQILALCAAGIAAIATYLSFWWERRHSSS